jgi:hypothetical protein
MKKHIRSLLIALLLPLLLLSGCGAPQDTLVAPELTEAASAPAAVSFTEEVFLELTNEKYAGREYAAPGNTAAGEYIADTLTSLGLSPFYENSYFYGFSYEGVTENNIVAYRPGTEGKNAVVLCAHFDGWNKLGGEGFTASYDNASGVAALITLAKLLSEASLKSDVVFLATNMEEHDFNGARAIAPYLSERYEYINLFNIDCIGYAAYDDGALDVYGRDKPNNLSLAVAAALGANQQEGNYSGDSIAFTQQNIAVCALSDMKYISGSGIQEPMHSPEDVRENVDCEKVERFSQALAGFILENGDTAFAELAPEAAALTEEELAKMAETERLIATVPSEQSLAYDEAYCCRLESNGSLALVMGIGQADTAEKVNYLFPNVEIKESIGAYTLTDVSINSDCYYGALMTVWEHGGIQTLLTSAPQDFDADTFAEGERYRFALPAPGTRLNSITLQYENGEDAQILQMYLYDSPSALTLAGFTDGAQELGGEFARYSVSLAEGEGEDSGYHAAVYAGENAGYAYLLSVRMQDGLMYTVYRDAEEFASLLRELDLPAMLLGAQKAAG